jgi:hypothetical protein
MAVAHYTADAAMIRAPSRIGRIPETAQPVSSKTRLDASSGYSLDIASCADHSAIGQNNDLTVN